MSERIAATIFCPCGFEARGRGRGVDGDDKAWKDAVSRYLGHLEREGIPIMDLNNPLTRQDVVKQVLEMIADIPDGFSNN